MEELSDKDFDQIFKNKIKEGFLEYEEESWLKMEKKLRKRDRLIFYRNASIILLFLSFGIALYLTPSKKIKTIEVIAAKKTDKIDKTIDLPKNLKEVIYSPKKEVTQLTIRKKNSTSSLKNTIIPKSQLIILADTTINEQNAMAQNIASTTKDQTPIQNPKALIAQVPAALPNNIYVVDEQLLDKPKNSSTKRIKLPPIGVSIAVGPDFNSTENTVGGKGSMAFGIGVSVKINKRLSAQTGLNYGSKNYNAEGYDYTFNNPNIVNVISGIDASCKVIEIPLRASYALVDNQKSRIDLNAGLSSYIMLKENYRFVYVEGYGRKDRFLEKKNANQHYLSVIDLSATYNIKLKNKKFALGLEPYVKIPLSGIGEGSVRLKSSGISLKLNYELNNKK